MESIGKSQAIQLYYMTEDVEDAGGMMIRVYFKFCIFKKLNFQLLKIYTFAKFKTGVLRLIIV